MNKYNVGDKVTVRSDLVLDKLYGEDYFIERMNEFSGQEVTIASVGMRNGASIYKLKEDDYFCWTEEMFEDNVKPSTTRGYFGIGIINGKCEQNIGTLFRSGLIYGASFIFTVGKRYKKQSSDTVKTYRSIPLFNFPSIKDLKEHLPYDCTLIGIELHDKALTLDSFHHPERACYLLGAEDHGLTKEAIEACHRLIKLPGEYCLNVAVAGSIVVYDRYVKNNRI